MKSVIILRGVSGSGKSEFASFLSHNDNTFVACADDFFFDESGKYVFNPAKLKDAHAWCLARFTQALKQYHCVIVANTNTSEWEFERYETLAKEAGFRVFHLVVENRHGNKNVHSVPSDVLEKQKARLLSSISL